VTEIPEHLLKRSQARKAGGDAAAAAAPSATTPAVAGSSAPAVAAPKAEVVPAGPPPAKPDIPVVAAYKARKKIPVWAMVTLSILPLWAFMYVIALRPEPVTASGPLGTGATVYGNNCVGCHQAGGAGVAGGAYAFTDKSAMTTFPHIEDQLRWVYLGTAAYTAAGVTIAGDPNRDGGPHVAGSNGLMPAQKGQQTEAEILGAVCEERYALGGAAEDTEEFALWCAPDSAVYAALLTGAANFDNLHTVIADKGILEIGSVPKAGTPADG
jgi:mono/diheme cytochrome c family protein